MPSGELRRSQIPDTQIGMPAPPAELGRIHFKNPAGLSILPGLAKSVPMTQVHLNNYKYHGNPVLTGGGVGEWDERGIERMAVLRVAQNDWRMWYEGRGSDDGLRIGLATSEDGVEWKKSAANPVLEGTMDWEGDRVSPTSALFIDGLFYLYYWAPGHITPPAIKHIGLAVSEDGISWIKKGIVLTADPAILDESPATGGTGVDAGKVFYIREENRWYMIFAGFGPHGSWNGLAESDDGIQWKKVKAPLLKGGGLFNRRGSFVGQGQTLRCPMQVGSLWTALGVLVSEGQMVPAVALELDEWVALGRRTLYPNQDDEAHIAPWSIEVADEWFYIYYQIHGGAKTTKHPSLGLIRAPKLSSHQPMELWAKTQIPIGGATSMILENDGRCRAYHLVSDQPGEVRLVVWNPAEDCWVDLPSTPVSPGILCTMTPVSAHTKTRLRFVPDSAPATVSAWALPG